MVAASGVRSVTVGWLGASGLSVDKLTKQNH